MTDTLFQKVEEKMMMIVDEMDKLRKENIALKFEKETYMRKLQDFVSLLDSIQGSTAEQHTSAPIRMVEPVLVQV